MRKKYNYEFIKNFIILIKTIYKYKKFLGLA